MTVPGTAISGEVRTISGTSLDTGSGQGSDTPFVVQSVESVGINKINYLNSPRIIASRVNETNNSSITVFRFVLSIFLSLAILTKASTI